MICPQFEITYNYALDSLNNMNINAYDCEQWKYKPYVYKLKRNYPI